MVLETRPRKYPKRSDAHLVREKRKKGKKKEYKDDPGGTGTEIVREVKACPSCAAAHGVVAVR